MNQTLLVVVLKRLPLLRIDTLGLERASTFDVYVGPPMLGKPRTSNLVVWRRLWLSDEQNALVLGTNYRRLRVRNLRTAGKLGMAEEQDYVLLHLYA